MKYYKVIVLAFLFVSAVSSYAQNVSDLIISEVLAEPDSAGVIDDYGRRGGWIEIYNTSMGTVKFGGCYLTDDPTNLKKSLIPKSDLATQLGPRQSRVFYASGRTHDGTFYCDFTLAPGKTVYLVSNDGRTIIDQLTIPEDLPAGKSVAKLATDTKGLVFETVAPCDPTPGAYNGDPTAASKSDQMAERDPHGWILTLVSVSVVFSALAILWFFFWLLFERPAKKRSLDSARDDKKSARKGNPVISTKAKGRMEKSTPDGEVAAAIALALDMEESGDLYAAIALALHLELGATAHDAESFVLTIRPNPASAWNDPADSFRRKP